MSAWLANLASRQLKLAAAQRDVAAWTDEIGLPAEEVAEGRARARRSLGLPSILESEAEHGPPGAEQRER